MQRTIEKPPACDRRRANESGGESHSQPDYTPREYRRQDDGLIRVGKRIVGEVVNGVLCKRMRPEHFLQRPPGIAWAVDAIEAAEQAGVTRLEAHADGRLYWLSMADFRRLCFRIHRAPFEPQLVVELGKWHIVRRGEARTEQLTLAGL
jgi:hypothetical protein